MFRASVSPVATLAIGVNVLIRCIDARGQVVFEDRRHNLITAAGRDAVRDGLSGGPCTIAQFAVGTGDRATQDADIALEAEVYRDAVTKLIADISKLTVQYYLPTGAANGCTLSEAALITSAGVMFARINHTPYEKNENISTTYSWDINIASK